MNIQPLFEKITDKWIVKVICFVIALLLYFMHQAASIEKKSFIVPLSVKQDGGVVAVGVNDESGNEINSVKLIVRAEADDIAKIESHRADIKAYLDITNFAKEGCEKVPVYLDFPEAVKLIEPLEITSEPENVYVKMEKLLCRYVPIVPSLSGEVDRGYIQNDISVVPNCVFISGAESVVSEIDGIITEDIDVINHFDSFSVKTKLMNLNKAINVEEPEEIYVHVSITAVQDLKLFKDIAVQFVGVRPELKIAEKSSQQSVSANLAGNLLFLEKLSSSRLTARVDCSKITEAGEYDMPVSIFVPSGVVNADKEKKSIKVVFEDVSIASDEESVNGESADAIVNEKQN